MTVVASAQTVTGLKRRAQPGSTAQFNLGLHTTLAKAADRSFEAVHWYRKSAERACQRTIQPRLALRQRPRRDPGQCASGGLVSQSGGAGLAGAQCNLGLMYAHGNGVPKDAVEAVQWYQKAAEQGHASAQNNLGWAYDHGKASRRMRSKQYVGIAGPAIRAMRLHS